MILLAEIEVPEGAVADFSLMFAVILLGPLIVQRAKIPGIIGLLAGGYLIGPHGLGFISSSNQTLPELGQFGLLYLMFVAGLELDLKLLGENRRAAVSFGIITFAVPMVAGVAVGVGLGWDTAAALLLGSLLASHTLILYPTVRDAGIGADPAVASAVGATVLTDTLALVVLAGVAGTETGSGSTAQVLGEIALGLGVLLVVSLVVLPKLAHFAFEVWGGDRAARYLVSVLSFLLMAAVAETFSIEGIVGAFFAGLALNRLVPNEGPSMERIEFFGSAVFIPVFLISVGLLLDPKVMFSAETLGVAGLLVLACVGGKAVAAAVTHPLLHFTWPQVGVIFCLTTPQAAATLAATLVGFDIGLFSTSVVNAVLVLILVSILVSTLAAPRFVSGVPHPERAGVAMGARVLLAVRPGGPTGSAVHLARRLARADSGVAEVFVAHTADEIVTPERDMHAMGQKVFRGTLDGEAHRAVGLNLPEAVAHAARSTSASTIVIDLLESGMPATDRIDMATAVPVTVLQRAATGQPKGVWLVGDPARFPAARTVADRLAPGAVLNAEDGGWPTDLAPGQAVVIGVEAGRALPSLDAIAEHGDHLVLAVFEPNPDDVIEPPPDVARRATSFS
jgi:Kef-type K+ transport system membrane component KefB